MATMQYFGSKPVSDWNPNGSFESGHDFINQISEQKGKIAGKESEYATQQGELGSARDAYKQAYQNQQNYSDLYRTAKGEEGVDDAKAQYQKSLASVNATNSAMNNLPSSINAGANVVLNASQRNAALGNQMTKYQNTLDYQTRQNAGDRDMYQTALGAAQDLAKQNAAIQRQDTQIALQDYQSQMDYANSLYNQLLQERSLMRQIYGDMYEDEYRHMQQEIEAWAQNLQAETQRYAQDQETARNNARIAAQNYATDVSKYLGSGYAWNGNEWVNPQNQKYKNWDFGNGYSLQQLANGQAAYYKNGNAVSAGDFLEHTGANGANWDLWNDVWNNGVSTQGVGSDTVNAFNRMSPSSSKYNYLFGV